MKALLAISVTVGLLAACYVVSALVCFDLTWILILVTSLWAGIDSRKIELHRYKTITSGRPVALFCCCYILWIFVFPWYLWVRFKIKAGEVTLKNESLQNISPIKRFFRQLSRKAERVAEWGLVGLVALKLALLVFCIEESWRGPRVWDNYKHELEAKGESFDWEAIIPPPVPDSQNFFRAPMMSEWFIKPAGKIAITEDLSKRLADTNTTPVVAIHTGGHQTLLASAAGGVERGASRGRFLAASRQLRLREQCPELFPGFVGEPAAPHSTESGAGRFGVLCEGVASEVRMKLTGHKTESVHRGYTHHELEKLRSAIQKIPSLQKS
jgi:hypothetical protein